MYFEIQADNIQRAVDFYRQVFDWKIERDPNLPIEYWRIHAEKDGGGILLRPAKAPGIGFGTNAFVCSFEVKSFDATAKVITKLGGQIALPKFAIPGKCWQGYFLDLEGNTFGIFEVDKKAA